MKATLTLDTQDLVTTIQQGTLLLLGQGLLEAEKEREEEIKGSPKAPEAPKEKAQEAPKEAKTPKEKAPEAPKAEEVNVDELRRLFKEKNTKENRPKLKAIIDTVGAESVSDIKKEDYAEVISALKKIEA